MFALGAVLSLVLAFFFLTAVMAIAGVILVLLVLRALWSGKNDRRRDPQIIDGEYSRESDQFDPPMGR